MTLRIKRKPINEKHNKIKNFNPPSTTRPATHPTLEKDNLSKSLLVNVNSYQIWNQK